MAEPQPPAPCFSPWEDEWAVGRSGCRIPEWKQFCSNLALSTHWSTASPCHFPSLLLLLQEKPSSVQLLCTAAKLPRGIITQFTSIRALSFWSNQASYPLLIIFNWFYLQKIFSNLFVTTSLPALLIPTVSPKPSSSLIWTSTVRS